jgi:hypothetical protein
MSGDNYGRDGGIKGVSISCFLFPVLLLAAFRFYLETARRHFLRFPAVLTICVTFIGISVHISERNCGIYFITARIMCHFRNVLDRNSAIWNDFVSQCGKGRTIPDDAREGRNAGNRIGGDSTGFTACGSRVPG